MCSLAAGPIPWKMGNLAALESLDLQGNQLVGEILVYVNMCAKIEKVEDVCEHTRVSGIKCFKLVVT